MIMQTAFFQTMGIVIPGVNTKHILANSTPPQPNSTIQSNFASIASCSKPRQLSCPQPQTSTILYQKLVLSKDVLCLWQSVHLLSNRQAFKWLSSNTNAIIHQLSDSSEHINQSDAGELVISSLVSDSDQIQAPGALIN